MYRVNSHKNIQHMTFELQKNVILTDNPHLETKCVIQSTSVPVLVQLSKAHPHLWY